MTTKSHPDEDAEKPKRQPAKKKDDAKEAEGEATQPAEAPAKKEPKERHFVDAKTGETIAKPKQGGTGEATKAAREEMHAERKGNALPFRIGAIALWVLGIAFEVLTILTMNETLQLPQFPLMTWVIIFLVIDLVVVVAGSQLWKHANHISPASKENKLAYWLQTDLGILIAVIAFAPIIILMLQNKNLDKKTKQICSIVAGLALVVAVGSGVDYHPTTQEDLDKAEAGAAVLSDDGLAYWTEFGKVYHFNPDCQYIKNSSTIYSGTIQDAVDAGRYKGCSGCAVEGGSDVLANANPDAVAAAAANAISVIEGGANTDTSNEGEGEPADTQEELPKAA